MTSSPLPIRHALLALAVVAVWGTNFVVIKVALGHLPPLLFATLRFTFAFLPAALLVKRPAAPWRALAAYGVFIGLGQFGVLYIAMNGYISPGLASLVVQAQVVFTIALAMRITGERVAGFQVVALALAAVGLIIIGLNAGSEATPLGLGLVLVAAASWAAGNMVTRAYPGADMLAFVVWASLFSIPPLVVLAVIFEGWPAIAAGLRDATPITWAAVLWQSVGNTLFGYAAWGWLLARHPAATITPMALLVPVFGIGAAVLLLGEPLQPWKLAAAALVLGGLALNTLWPMRRRPTS
jgi:O-acetylserine/cysteine efflux transporter